VLLAVLFVVLRPGGTPQWPVRMPDQTPSPVASALPAAERAAPVSAESSDTSTTPPVPAASTAAEPRTFDLQIRGGRMAGGPSTLTVGQGELIVLHVISDREDELHVHGYDLALKLRANTAGSLAFQADRSGRFDVELHHGGGEIAAIEVQPR
jgi:hypothetical protein